MPTSEASTEEDQEFLHRRLCPDGSCIGLLDSTGICKECGMVGSESTTDPRLRGLKKPAVEAPTPSPEIETSEPVAEVSAQPADFADRRLCPDGACIGVVGTDGTCGVCGAVA